MVSRKSQCERLSPPDIPETEVTIEFPVPNGMVVKGAELDNEPTKFTLAKDKKGVRIQVPVGVNQKLVEVKFN